MAEAVVECLYNWNLQKVTFKVYVLTLQQAIQVETKMIAKLLWMYLEDHCIIWLVGTNYYILELTIIYMGDVAFR